MMSKFLLSLVFLLPIQSFAKASFNPTLLSVVDKYSAAKLVTMKVSKKVKSELLGKETEYLGEISLAKEKFRLDTQTPEKALVLFDGKILWSIQYPPKDLGGETQVLKSKVTKKNRSQILLSALLDKASLKKNFKVTGDEAQGTDRLITVEPLTKDLTVKKINLIIDVKAKLLKQVSYNDDADNLVTMTLTEINFPKTLPKDLFKIEIPKGAQVTEL